ncbi:MAG TPA: ABC transporter ATP-binding protein [Syntrophobacteria bacterium]|nr:ABC transporter ATP-binding protein [Syntrophobacteria bacterium]
MKPLVIENLQKTYLKGVRRQKVLAVRGLSLEVEEGEVFGFVGPNGAGKSTTIKVLCNLIRPTTGRASLMGKDVTSAEARRQVGYLPENPSYYDYLTGEELLAFNGATHGMSAHRIRERSTELLEMVELTPAAKRPLRTYSKGMVQRLGIAASLIHDPQVLIWDEPMSGLDPIGRKQTTDLMLDLRRQGKTIFFSTHILADVEQVCDRIGMIVQGDMAYIGKLEEIRSAAIEHYRVVFQPSGRIDAALFGPYRPEVHGGRYHLEVPPAQFGEIMKRLLSEGAEIVSVEPKRVRLEDVFVGLTRRTEVGR